MYGAGVSGLVLREGEERGCYMRMRNYSGRRCGAGIPGGPARLKKRLVPVRTVNIGSSLARVRMSVVESKKAEGVRLCEGRLVARAR